MVFNTIFTNSTQQLATGGNVGIGTTIPTDLLSLGPNGAAFPAPSGSAPLYACRAWVNFNGTTAGTNPASMTILGSGNVSSVTRTATGQFTVNFTKALPDANYVLAGSCTGQTTTGANMLIAHDNTNTTKTTTSVAISTYTLGSVLTNVNNVGIMIIS